MEDIIPDEIKNFLLANIESILQLEALLLLRRHQDQKLSCETIAERLYVSSSDASGALRKLVVRGLIMMEIKGESSVFQYNYANQAVIQAVDRVADVYSNYLIPVTNLIHNRPLKSLQEFSDAFKLREE
jgi:predicted transcriptional regulator